MLAAEAAMPGRGFAEKGVLVTSCHPGVVTSPLLQNLGFSSGFQPAASGAQTPLKLALSVPPENGSFWVDKQKTKCKFAADLAGRQALWEACEALDGYLGDLVDALEFGKTAKPSIAAARASQ